jgi:hypothetical protein
METGLVSVGLRRRWVLIGPTVNAQQVRGGEVTPIVTDYGMTSGSSFQCSVFSVQSSFCDFGSVSARLQPFQCKPKLNIGKNAITEQKI